MRTLPVLLLAAALTASPAGAWTWPTDVSPVVLEEYRAPARPWAPGHRGIDVLAGETLLAPASGVVRFAGWVVDRPVLSIDHGGGVWSSFEPVVALVAAGDEVAAGDPIGVVQPGHCAVRCVHVGVRVDGSYRNPMRWFGGALRPVLLPTSS